MKKALLFLILSIVFISNLYTQGRLVTGWVTSHEDDLGLPGVTVVVKSTSNGTVTDMNGNFTLSGIASTCY